MSERAHDNDPAQPRKRIAVACQRCRKRKIRCSGDPGNGMPCYNCKNAGAEPCQFLRVASTEAILPDRGFTYDLDAARSYQARGALVGSYAPQYPGDIPDGLSRYQAPAAPYSYGGRYYQGVPNWTPAYPEDVTDYTGLSYSQQYHMGQEPSLVYRMARAPPSGPMYGDTGAAYEMVRPAVSTDSSSSYSMSAAAGAVPTSFSSATSDRYLPTPVSRATHGSGLPGYRAADVSSAFFSSKASQAGTATATASAGGTSDLTGGYASYENSPVSAYASSSSSGHRLSTSTGCTDVYSSSSGHGSLFSDSDSGLRHQDSSSELSYKYSDSRRDAGTATLSNGHPYTVPSHPVSTSHLSHHQNPHTHGLSTSAYFISGNDTNSIDTPGTPAASDVGGAPEGVGGGGSATGHPGIHQRVTADSLSAA